MIFPFFWKLAKYKQKPKKLKISNFKEVVCSIGTQIYWLINNHNLFVNRIMVFIYKSCKEEILFQPPGEPWEHHLNCEWSSTKKVWATQNFYLSISIL